MDAPAADSSWGVTPLTAPRVPTGMKAGVSTPPWGVVRRPRRAAGAAPRAAAPEVAGRISKASRSATAKRGRARGRPLGPALRLGVLAEVDDPGLDARGQLQGEAVRGERRIPLEVVEVVGGGVAVRLLVLEVVREEVLGIDEDPHRLDALLDALVPGKQLQAVRIALLFREPELDGEVVEQRVHAAGGAKELEDLAGIAADLQGLRALEVSIPGGHLAAADHHRDRSGGLVFPAHAVGGGIREGAGRLL